jgi:hypothetical protein
MIKRIIPIILILLLVQINLKATPPDWAVNAADYEFAMTVTSEIFINQERVAGPDDVLGAFVGDELRGVANAVHDVAQDRYIFFLTIFSNQVADESVKFSFYRAQTDELIALWDSIAFQSGTNLGSVSNPWPIHDSQPEITCTITFDITDTNAQPITDAVITFDGTTMDAGNYEITDVTAGTYSYSVARENFITYEADLSVPEDIETLVVPVELQPVPDEPQTYQVIFSVIDMQGGDVSDVNLVFNGQDHGNTLVVTDLEPGIYPYTISKPGYNSRSGEVSVISADLQLEVILLEDDLSWESVDLAGFRMFPNPAIQYLYIEMDDQLMVEGIQIFDVGGNLVMEQPADETFNRIDISMLGTGLYFVKLVDAHKAVVIGKLIKN